MNVGKYNTTTQDRTNSLLILVDANAEPGAAKEGEQREQLVAAYPNFPMKGASHFGRGA